MLHFSFKRVYHATLLLSSLLLGCIPYSESSRNFLDVKKDEFMWGVATAAYQIEGATKFDGRGSSIWDDFSHVANNENADVADLSYYKYRDDITMMKSLGVKYYRFSISWSRIFPTGKGAVNSAGIDHYNALIDSLVAADITPVVTLYHWDLPQGLQDAYLGWLSKEIVDDFVAYADTCFALFGDRVKIWITLNEPWTFVLNGYVSGVFAPGRCSNRTRCEAGDSAVEGYQVAHHALLAHAAVVDLYRSDYADGNGVIGITLNIDWAYPLDPTSPQDRAAAERRNEFTFSWFADPIFFGMYPLSMQKGAQGRLPQFTKQESASIKGSTDFIGLNHYSSWYLSDSEGGDPNKEKGWFGDQHTRAGKFDLSGELIGPQGGSVWLNMVPEGLFETLQWVSNRYNQPAILITENGCDMLGEDEPRIFDASVFFSEVKDDSGDRGEEVFTDNKEADVDTSLEDMMNHTSAVTRSLLMDDFRVQYFTLYLSQMQRAMRHGVDIRGYFAWSLLDNFEWADGFSKRFGLFRVNFTDPERSRAPKASAFFYRNFIQQFSSTENLSSQELSKSVPDLRRSSPRIHQSRVNVASDSSGEADDLFSYFNKASEYFFQNATRFMRLGHHAIVP